MLSAHSLPAIAEITGIPLALLLNKIQVATLSVLQVY